MFAIRGLIGVFAILGLLAGCVETTGGGPSLATKGNLSPEAIRLLSQSEKLISLEQEQKNARKRQTDFAVQAGIIGGVLGGLAGNVTCKAANCSSNQRTAATIAGAGAGAAIGANQGKKQAQRQNAAAKAENALKRRIAISSQQLTTARAARQRAQRVAQFHQRKLSSLKREVKAGRASKESLRLAQADARADSRQIQKASRAMGSGASSLDQRGGGKSSTTLTRRQAQMKAEQNATTKSYNALVKSMSNSAL